MNSNIKTETGYVVRMLRNAPFCNAGSYRWEYSGNSYSEVAMKILEKNETHLGNVQQINELLGYEIISFEFRLIDKPIFFYWFTSILSKLRRNRP